jgi:thymidine phosphorylase
VGLALLRIGGGRARPGDVIDPRVGLTDVLGVGELFSPDRPLAVLQAADAAQAEGVAREVAEAFEWVEEAQAVPPRALVVQELMPPVAA